MEFIKKINNNVAFAQDHTGTDYIVLGKGIGFSFNAKDIIPKEAIERTFISENSQNGSSSLDVLTNISSEVIDISTKVSQYAEEELGIIFNNAQYLILADHLSYAIKRNREGIEYTPLNQWELKQLFPKEYEVAKNSLKIINDEFDIDLDTAEIGFITNHFVNAGSEFSSLKNNMKMTKLIKQIINLVEYRFQKSLDEESFDYSKFVNHLRYFILRKLNNHIFSDHSIDDELVRMYQEKYPESYRMAEKIEEFLYLKEGWLLTADEKLFLTVHVRRLAIETTNKSHH